MDSISVSRSFLRGHQSFQSRVEVGIDMSLVESMCLISVILSLFGRVSGFAFIVGSWLDMRAPRCFPTISVSSFQSARVGLVICRLVFPRLVCPLFF